MLNHGAEKRRVQMFPPIKPDPAATAVMMNLDEAVAKQ
jgi:hypothetical protein